MSARYRVVENTQVNYNGQVYGGGETLEVDEYTVAPWLAGGYVTLVEGEAPAPKRSRKRAAE